MPSVCGTPGSVPARLGLWNVLLLSFVLTAESRLLDVGELGDEGVEARMTGCPLSEPCSAPHVCMVGSRIRCDGMLSESSRHGQKWRSRGFKARREAQMMHTLASMVDQVTACMPDSVKNVSQLSHWVVESGRKLTNKLAILLKDVDRQ